MKNEHHIKQRRKTKKINSFLKKLKIGIKMTIKNNTDDFVNSIKKLINQYFGIVIFN